MRVIALVLATLLSGCGTVANYVTRNPPKTYGGDTCGPVDPPKELVDQAEDVARPIGARIVQFVKDQ